MFVRVQIVAKTYDFSFKNSPRVNSESRRDLPFLPVVVVVVFDLVAVAVVVFDVVVVSVVDFILEPAMLPIKFTHVGAEQPALALAEAVAGNERLFSMADNA